MILQTYVFVFNTHIISISIYNKTKKKILTEMDRGTLKKNNRKQKDFI